MITLYTALVNVFNIICENWTTILNDLALTSSWLVSVYFISFVTLLVLQICVLVCTVYIVPKLQRPTLLTF